VQLPPPVFSWIVNRTSVPVPFRTRSGPCGAWGASPRRSVGPLEARTELREV